MACLHWFHKWVFHDPFWMMFLCFGSHEKWMSFMASVIKDSVSWKVIGNCTEHDYMPIVNRVQQISMQDEEPPLCSNPLKEISPQLLWPTMPLQAAEIGSARLMKSSLSHFPEIKCVEEKNRRKIEKPKLSIFICVLLIYVALFLIFLPLLGTGSNCSATS